MKPETKFWQRIKRDVDRGLRGGFWQRVEVRIPPGFPDTVVQLGERTLFVELKQVEKLSELPGEIRPDQATWNAMWRKGGGSAYVCCWVVSEQREAWFVDARAVRQGVLAECIPPL